MEKGDADVTAQLGSNVRETCEGEAGSALAPPRAVAVDALALPARGLCQSAPAEHSGHEFCGLMAYRMFCVSLCSAWKKEKGLYWSYRKDAFIKHAE